MKTLLSFLIIAVTLCAAFLAPQAAVTVLAIVAPCAGLVYLVANHSRKLRRSRLVGAVNALAANWGTHENSFTLLATAAIATRYLLVKRGADVSHAAAIAATSDEPLGVCTDEAEAAEDPINIELLSITNRTVPMVASGVIALDANVYSTATGKISAKPTAAGTYWRVGKALQAATADTDVIEVEPIKPRKLIVIAALTSTDGTAAAASASLANLAAEAEKIGDDVRAIAAALNGDADVALATT